MQGYDPPASLEEARSMIRMDPDQPATLESALQKIAVTYPVLQDRDSLELVAYQAAMDNAQSGAVYVELRFAPALHARKSLRYSEIIYAALSGMHQANLNCGIQSGLILCLIWGADDRESEAVLEAGLAYAGNGVVGIDIAGDEARFSATRFKPLLECAKSQGLGITIHAGEAGGPENVWTAVQELGASRIGHGIAAYSDPDCVAMLIDREITLEVCPTSNVCTRAVESIQEHPVLKLLRAGVRISIGDDDPSTFSTNVQQELRLLSDAGMTQEEIFITQMYGARAAFCSDSVRNSLIETVQRASEHD